MAATAAPAPEAPECFHDAALTSEYGCPSCESAFDKDARAPRRMPCCRRLLCSKCASVLARHPTPGCSFCHQQLHADLTIDKFIIIWYEHSSHSASGPRSARHRKCVQLHGTGTPQTRTTNPATDSDSDAFKLASDSDSQRVNTRDATTMPSRARIIAAAVNFGLTSYATLTVAAMKLLLSCLHVPGSDPAERRLFIRGSVVCVFSGWQAGYVLLVGLLSTRHALAAGRRLLRECVCVCKRRRGREKRGQTRLRGCGDSVRA